ncbi:MAG: rhomboid family intramembrane serine protease [Candidatus Anstonellales archaeon]
MAYYNAVLLISITIFIAFIAQIIIPNFTESLYFLPSNAINEPWRFITSIFLHAGFLHLFLNLYAFILFGSILEKRVGPIEIIKIFLLSGISGSLFYYLATLLNINPGLPALGASGAVFGIMGATAVFFPNLVIFIWFMPMRMKQAVIFWFILEFLSTFNINSGIASAAHLGGLVIGYLYAKYIIKKQSSEWWVSIAMK